MASDEGDSFGGRLGRYARVGTSVGGLAVKLAGQRYLGIKGGFVGMSSFGASGPYEQLYKHFGITPEAVAAAAKQRL